MFVDFIPLRCSLSLSLSLSPVLAVLLSSHLLFILPPTPLTPLQSSSLFYLSLNNLWLHLICSLLINSQMFRHLQYN